ncbi:MAG: minor capsid protein [Campylobacter sp.]|nr:minor capsid protein [Campylobacter sp.]
MQIDFFEEPTEVVDKLKSKIPTLADDLDKIKGDAYKKAFTISDIAKKSLLADIQDSLVEALKDGKGFDEWRSDLFEHLQAKGWADKFESLNDDEISVLGDSSRLKLIYDTNIRQAYAEANYETGINSNAEFIRYVAVLDERTRFSHASAHGLILPIDDPWWEINYPPNGFNCRCSVMFLTAQSLEARGWKAYDGTFPNIADKGFRKHSGKPYSATLKRLDKDKVIAMKRNDEFIRKELAIKDDVPNLSEAVEEKFNLQKYTKELSRAVDEILVKENIKAPINSIKVGELSDFVREKVKEILGINLKTNEIILTKKSLTHARFDRKVAFNQALTNDEIKEIPIILNDKKSHILADTDKKNLVVLKRTDTKQTTKIAIHLNYKRKKIINYIVTYSKVNYLDEFNQGIYKKIQ